MHLKSGQETFVKSKRRKIARLWLSVAQETEPGCNLIIKVGSEHEARMMQLVLREELEAIKSFLEDFYNSAHVATSQKDGIYFILIKIAAAPIEEGVIQNRYNKEERKAILAKSRYTRFRQIKLMLSDGFTPADIRSVLKDKITPDEEILLNNFKNAGIND